MNDNIDPDKLTVLVLCTVSVGLDAVYEVLQNSSADFIIVSLDPEKKGNLDISGFIDVSDFALKWKIDHYYVSSYNLQCEKDRCLLSSLKFDLIWVAGWQRLIPDWLISLPKLGSLGGHGSPDGICGGRGRSPQNWAIMLGCGRFDLALFKITSGIDDGPIIAQRSFFYNETDDIAISYKKVALCMAEMMAEILANPKLIANAYPQKGKPFYYPQRIPEDGFADWFLSRKEVCSHCRALTKPYPGLRTLYSELVITIWECVPFDDVLRSAPGVVDFVFLDGSFLVSCRDGRVLVKSYESTGDWRPSPKMLLISCNYLKTLSSVVARHAVKLPESSVALRIMSVLREGK